MTSATFPDTQLARERFQAEALPAACEDFTLNIAQTPGILYLSLHDERASDKDTDHGAYGETVQRTDVRTFLIKDRDMHGAQNVLSGGEPNM